MYLIELFNMMDQLRIVLACSVEEMLELSHGLLQDCIVGKSCKV